MTRLSTWGLLACALSGCGGGTAPAPDAGSGSGASPAVAPKPVVVDGEPRFIVLVLDGVDPDWLDTWRSTLPHLDGLVGSASQVRRLKTTSPPQSSVVWSSFGTSRSPANHGVFGAVVRDPLTYLPRPGDLEFVAHADSAAGTIKVGLDSYRSGTPFWEVAASSGVGTKVLFAPYAYPLHAIDRLRLVAGEGTPDLRGQWGAYTVYDSQPPTGQDPRGGSIERLRTTEGRLAGTLLGPLTPSGEPASVPITIEPRPPDRVSIRIGQGSDAPTVEARLGEFTQWVSVTFPVGSVSVRGKTRFYPLTTGLRTTVYASPVVVDAAAPYLAVSSPPDWAKKLVDDYGELKLLGWEHETQALTDGVVPAEVFARDRSSLNKIRRAALLGEMDKADGTRLFVAFDHDIDRVWHALSAQADRSSPAYDGQLASTYAGLLKESYGDADTFVGEIMKRLGPKDRLLLLSGHGFHPWRWEVHLNSWLKEQGYLVLAKAGGAGGGAGITGRRTGEDWTYDVDWTKTKAYAVGGGAVYLNLEGREGRGSVKPADALALATEIETKLKAWQHAKEKVVTEVVVHVGLLDGNPLEPDLQVGFATGFGASRATWAGDIPSVAVDKNARRWSGDHASNAAAETAGFVLGNTKGIPVDASILDLGPTVLGFLGVPVPADYEGKPWR